MSEEKELTKIEVLNWHYDAENDRIELLVDVDGRQLTTYLTVPFLKEMVEIVPSMDEENQIKTLLELIYKIREKRILNVEALDKSLEDLRRQHADARKELKSLKINKGSKNSILRWNGIVKSLAAEKVVIAEKRYLIKLLLQEEGDLRAKLARIISRR